MTETKQDRNKEYRDALERLIINYQLPMDIGKHTVTYEQAIKWAEIVDFFNQNLIFADSLKPELVDLAMKCVGAEKKYMPEDFGQSLDKVFKMFDALVAHPIKVEKRLYIDADPYNDNKRNYEIYTGYAGPNFFFIEFIFRNKMSISKGFIETKDGKLQYDKVFSKPLEDHSDEELEKISEKIYLHQVFTKPLDRYSEEEFEDLAHTMSGRKIKLPFEELRAYRDRAKLRPESGEQIGFPHSFSFPAGENKIFGDHYHGGKIVE